MKERSDGSVKVIIAALIGNLAIAIAKFVAASITQSSAMFAEAFHSLADTGNQVLMLVGLRRAKRPPDRDHPLGYGKETYFWSFVVAISIFTIGSVVAFYEGGHKLHAILSGQAHESRSQLVAFLVLGVSLLIEGYVLIVALREFRKRFEGQSTVEALNETRGTTLITVLFEDAAAVTGLLVALLGVGLTAVTDNPIYDAIASLLIGVILAVVAFFLGYMTKRLLIGHSASRRVEARIDEAIRTVDGVDSVLELITLHMGRDYILLNVGIEFRDGMITDELEATIDTIETRVKAAVPEVKRIFIEADSFLTKPPTADPPARPHPEGQEAPESDDA